MLKKLSILVVLGFLAVTSSVSASTVVLSQTVKNASTGAGSTAYAIRVTCPPISSDPRIEKIQVSVGTAVTNLYGTIYVSPPGIGGGSVLSATVSGSGVLDLNFPEGTTASCASPTNNFFLELSADNDIDLEGSSTNVNSDMRCAPDGSCPGVADPYLVIYQYDSQGMLSIANVGSLTGAFFYDVGWGLIDIVPITLLGLAALLVLGFGIRKVQKYVTGSSLKDDRVPKTSKRDRYIRM